MMGANESATSGVAEPTEWIALLGRRDMPTDGVEDYCTFLGRALAQRGVTLNLTRVDWFGQGWMCCALGAVA